MKKIITTTILFCCVAFYINAQFLIEPEPAPKINFSFSPHYISTLPNGVRPLKQSALANPSLISDVVEGFPVNWIGKYLEMEISTISNGKLIKCSSTDDHLNEKQKNEANLLALKFLNKWLIKNVIDFYIQYVFQIYSFVIFNKSILYDNAPKHIE